MPTAVIAFAGVALALVLVFVAVWALDAHRSKSESTDEERQDVR